MSNNIVMITINDKGYVTPLDKASKIAIYDASKHVVIEELKNPYKEGFWILEEVFDKYDPAIIITGEISEELAYDVEENGVKVYVAKPHKIHDLIRDLFL
ncbi:NifB/NifX family molybdenum-iron cluster-binding protein [Staphylothermus hellenicus]|uniref:Response regulator receiver modulated metal dependent phosphohydrolase n=1 Tax=Staphylothermus hellenicus (strain DSM 12710 / JCM 10830 / BK20S6-10-b1 / P8) TaxID=591019 RepID=D7DAL3_STAHD|nr:histidine kinase [Staphylothermus hellenicus]ADI31210.1 response regulator receiver modulated metal dependent phosphohydrolase [Staphylothermus hellenicus DSM 12710]